MALLRLACSTFRDCSAFRDLILEARGLESIIEVVDKSNDQEIIMIGTRAISKLCRGKPLPPPQAVEMAIPTLSSVIQKSKDQIVLADAVQALGYISRCQPQGEEVIKSEIIPRLIELLE